jgi:hypothetical protein
LPQIDINSPLTDALSPLAHEVLDLDKDAAYSRLVVVGEGNRQAAARLRNATPEQLLTQPVVSPPDARAMLSGLWLWHDWLDSSHTISQELHTPTGSFWHAIMHRREGDFSNAKYWYARCLSHPIFKAMAPYANDVLHPLPADKSLLRLVRDGWDAYAFVDLVESAHDQPDSLNHKAAVALQKIEWRLLFDHCTRTAAGQI